MEQSINTHYNRRHVSRHFLTEETIKIISDLYSQGYTKEKISEITNVSIRQVSEKIKMIKNNIVNIWSEEEDNLLRRIYFRGITKPSQISKIITSKADWMIRNRIKFFERTNTLTVEETKPIVEKYEPVQITPTEQAGEQYYNDKNISLNLKEDEYIYSNATDMYEDGPLQFNDFDCFTCFE